MLNKLSINLRVLMLILVPTAIFVIIAYMSYTGYKNNQSNLVATDINLKTLSVAADLSLDIDKHYTYLLSDLEKGYFSWEATKEKTIQGKEVILKSLSAFKAGLPTELLDTKDLSNLSDIEERLTINHAYIQDFLETRSGSAKDMNEISAYLTKTQLTNAQDMHRHINSIDEKVFNDITKNTNNMVDVAFVTSKTIITAVAIGALFIIIIGFFIARSIRKPTRELYDVVSRLSEGEFDARAKVTGSDEIAKLSSAFNGLLDDRSVTLNKIDEEHQELNQSVFSLLQAVAELSEKDLTIRADVTEDATGPVADALNLLAEETEETLKKVKNIATDVQNSSHKVNSHLMSINKLAMKEQERAIETADQMNTMMERLDSISNSAASTNIMAGSASDSTKLAHGSVTDTLSGMSDIRTTVQETGKRIKQLGERSQEISHVIEIIETLAERTTLLALNASMQAVAAGEEGKGFSVIAEEIQRLAESSRESTGQISTLVKNIQQETNTTIETMDKTIEQVIEGSMKAEDAVDQMQKVLYTTSELVTAVDQIANASKEQVGISKDLKHKAESILKSTQVTGQELLSLTGLSRNMTDYAQQLVTSVDVFTLSDNKDEEKSTSNA